MLKYLTKFNVDLRFKIRISQIKIKKVLSISEDIRNQVKKSSRET